MCFSMRLKALTEAQREGYLRQLRAGETNCAEIARQTGYTQRAIWGWAHENGIELHRTRLKSQKNTAAQKDRALEMYLSGRSLKEIESETGVKGQIVNVLLRARGIPRHCTHKKSDETKQRAVSLYIQGLTQEQVAAQTGVSQSYLALLVKRAGALRGRLSWPKAKDWAMPSKARTPRGPKSLPKRGMVRCLARYPLAHFVTCVSPEVPWHESLLALVRMAYRAQHRI